MLEQPLSPDVAGALVDAYLEAWTERRSAARRRLLERCWGEDADFSSWTTHAHGLDALDSHVAAGQRQHPRLVRRVLTSEVHVSSDKLSYTWALVEEDGNVLVEGSEWAQVGGDDRFTRVTSFAGRPEPADA